MDFGGFHLPAELLVAVVRGLPIADLKRLRTVCKSLDAVASQFLFQKVYISSQLQDRENLTSISNHATFSHSVKEIVYDSTHVCPFEPLEGTPFSKASYKRLFWSGGYRLAGATYTKAAIERGFKRFQACFKDQEDLAEYCGPNLTKPTELDKLPADFSSLLESPLYHTEVKKYLPDDLVRLVEAIPKMPNIIRFSISDYRHTQNHKHYTHTFAADADLAGVPAITFSIKNEGIRGSDAVVLDPRPWPEPFEDSPPPTTDRSWYRGFTVLMQAASMTNMKRLGSFNVESGSEFTGISHTILHMPPSELQHTMNAFCNITSLNLKINSKYSWPLRPMFYHAHKWSHTLGSGDIAKVLSAATHLETLRLELEDSYGDEPGIVTPLSNMLGTNTWSCLRSFSLGHISLYGDEFLDFFDRHRQTLRSLRLEQVGLLSDKQSRQGKHDNSRHPWGTVFRNMAVDSIALVDFDMHLHLWSKVNFGLSECFKHSAHGAAEVYETLQSGCNKQEEPRCPY